MNFIQVFMIDGVVFKRPFEGHEYFHVGQLGYGDAWNIFPMTQTPPNISPPFQGPLCSLSFCLTGQAKMRRSAQANQPFTGLLPFTILALTICMSEMR